MATWITLQLPLKHIDKIIPQLYDGNVFRISLMEWTDYKKYTDPKIYVKIRTNFTTEIVVIKLLNDDRRMLLSQYLLNKQDGRAIDLKFIIPS
jgi:hypothetical protein